MVCKHKSLFVKDEVTKDPDLTEVEARALWDKLKELCPGNVWLHGGPRKEPIEVPSPHQVYIDGSLTVEHSRSMLLSSKGSECQTCRSNCCWES